MVDPSTFIAPGQRYARPGAPAWDTETQLTILHVGKTELGSVWVTYHAPDGEERADFADRFEAAVAAGDLVPVAGWGPVGRC